MNTVSGACNVATSATWPRRKKLCKLQQEQQQQQKSALVAST